MDHPAFVEHLVACGYSSCGPGCLAHIPCDWMDIANANQSLARHSGYLAEFPVNFLKPGEQSEGWCVLWRRRGSNNGAGTYLMPKYWRPSPNLRDADSPPILRAEYKTAFEFFRSSSAKTRIACRSMLQNPHPQLDNLRIRLNLRGPYVGQPPVYSKSSLSVEIGHYAVTGYSQMTSVLIPLLEGTKSPDRLCNVQAVRDFVLLAPAVIPL